MSRYVSRYIEANKKRIVILLLIFICGVGVKWGMYNVTAHGLHWNLLTVDWIGKQMELAFLPQLSAVKYNDTESNQWISKLSLSIVPILQYYDEYGNLDKTANNDSIEEWILEAQAMDENYIDENGELVGEEVLIEENTENYEPSVDLEKIADLDYLLSNYYVVDKTVGIDASIFNAVEWLEQDLSLAEDVEGPQILIYHTHSQEAFTDSIEGDLDTSIVGVADYLTTILEEEYGIEVLHHRGVYDLVDGVLDRSNAYNLAGAAVEEILEENPSIEMVIDLHRDGVSEDTHLVTMINGEPTAQIMFFNGLSNTISEGPIDYLYNPYIEDNLALSFQMQVAAEALYPGFTRRIYLKSYRYNLDLMPKCMLIEAGAQTNNLEEMYNAMEVLAEILYAVVGG